MPRPTPLLHPHSCEMTPPTAIDAVALSPIRQRDEILRSFSMWVATARISRTLASDQKQALARCRSAPGTDPHLVKDQAFAAISPRSTSRSAASSSVSGARTGPAEWPTRSAPALIIETA